MELLRRPMNKASLTAFWNVTDRLDGHCGRSVYVGTWLDYNRPGTAELMAPGYTLVNLVSKLCRHRQDQRIWPHQQPPQSAI